MKSDKTKKSHRSTGNLTRGRDLTRSSKQRSPQKFMGAENEFLVEGVAAIAEYLRFRRQAVKQVFAKEKSLRTVREQLSEFKVEIQSVSDQSELVRPATPAWAIVCLDTVEWNDFLSSSKDTGTVLVLDHISDPRNLGAIARSAAFFGVKHIIVAEKRQVLLTHASVNTAQGGFALCDLVVVVNISRTVEELKKLGFWILGAAFGGEPVRQLRGKFPKQAVVLGAEDRGISPNVLEKCDVVISIPGSKVAVESLNVSVAAGIILHELV